MDACKLTQPNKKSLSLPCNKKTVSLFFTSANHYKPSVKATVSNLCFHLFLGSQSHPRHLPTCGPFFVWCITFSLPFPAWCANPYRPLGQQSAATMTPVGNRVPGTVFITFPKSSEAKLFRSISAVLGTMGLLILFSIRQLIVAYIPRNTASIW